ncbi:MAG: hypothetical protein ACHRXM_31895 [Isosphaerales bacterium]
MPISTVEYDGDGNARDDLARLWSDAEQGDRQRITDAAFEVEDYLKANPYKGTVITNGVLWPVRYVDWDILRIFYQVFESEDKIIIIGFKLSP